MIVRAPRRNAESSRPLTSAPPVAARGRFNLTEPKSIWAEVDYFHANPARSELCDTATAWPWSSAPELEQPGSGLLRLDLSSLPRTLQG